MRPTTTEQPRTSPRDLPTSHAVSIGWGPWGEQPSARALHAPRPRRWFDAEQARSGPAVCGEAAIGSKGCPERGARDAFHHAMRSDVPQSVRHRAIPLERAAFINESEPTARAHEPASFGTPSSTGGHTSAIVALHRQRADLLTQLAQLDLELAAAITDTDVRIDVIARVPPERAFASARLLTVEEFSEVVGVSRAATYRMIRSGLPAPRVKHVGRRIDLETARAWMVASGMRRSKRR